MSLTGTLSELALCDLVEITTLGAKTGVLDVAHIDGSPAGRLAFRGGALVSASCGALRGERAFYALLGLKEGSFVFDPDLDPERPRPTCRPARCSWRPCAASMRSATCATRCPRTPASPSSGRLAGRGGGHGPGPPGPGQRSVGDIVEGALHDGIADEYDVLQALTRLRERGIVRLID